ncbi:glycosyltransferase [bacterium SCSIO 12696]|nr:glycosyltransferase [bacterium SCSIO 12696]
MLAAECNPKWHSLPALIYEYYCALNKLVDITLVTHIRNKEYLQPCLPKSACVTYIDTEVISKPLHKLSMALSGEENKSMTLQVAMGYPGYIYFEHLVWKKFGKAIRSGEYSLVHRASPMSPTLPSYIAKRLPVPFVIGPILGGLPWPKAFRREMLREGEWMNFFRWLHRWMPYYRSTYKKASAVLAAYEHTISDLPCADAEKIIDFSEGGIHKSDYPVRRFVENETKKVLFVGRLVPFKQPEVLIQAFAESDLLQKHQLIIVGDGPDAERLKSLVKGLNMEHCIKLTGRIPHQEVVSLMYESDIFAFPSIREQGGGVLTMASMASMPSVVVEYGGPSFRVPDSCGIRVPMGEQENLVEGFIKSLEYLILNPDEIKRRGIKAREFAEGHYRWSYKAEKTAEIYDWVLGNRSEKPLCR